MNETGSVKFSCDRVNAELSRFAEFEELNRVRRRLVDLGIVGIDANGIGFGNLSVRDGASSLFYITGSGTGGIAELTPADLSRVVSFDFSRNWLRCEGALASSESLTHAAVYESDPEAGAVIHVHDLKLWNALLKKKNIPATPNGVAYGTPEMAKAVQGLFQTSDLKDRRILVMTAHDGGLVTFGKTITEAFDILKSEI